MGGALLFSVEIPGICRRHLGGEAGKEIVCLGQEGLGGSVASIASVGHVALRDRQQDRAVECHTGGSASPGLRAKPAGRLAIPRNSMLKPGWVGGG